jgi:hypothetical protein
VSEKRGAPHFARIFQGPATTINLTPMHGTNVNQRAYRRLENEWGKTIRAGTSVDVRIELTYVGGSRRPRAFDIDYTIDGAPYYRVIENPASHGMAE